MKIQTNEQIDQYLVQWLAHYPFQRAQDLVLALTPFTGKDRLFQRLFEVKIDTTYTRSIKIFLQSAPK